MEKGAFKGSGLKMMLESVGHLRQAIQDVFVADGFSDSLPHMFLRIRLR
jgi:hypothetical protein